MTKPQKPKEYIDFKDLVEQKINEIKYKVIKEIIQKNDNDGKKENL